MKPTLSRRLAVVLASTAAFATLAQTVQALDAPPAAAVKPVTDTYFGTEVVDRYRYFEELKNPEVQSWMRAQAAYTSKVLDVIPGRAALLERIHALADADTHRGGFIRRGQRYFYELVEPGAQQPKLLYRDGLKGEEHLLLDPGQLGKGTSTHYALDYYMPSPDGKLIAYGLSAGGSEASVLHIMEVATGKVLPEAIDRSDNNVIAWREDSRSFYYLRYNEPTPTTPPAEVEYNARTYLHIVGLHPKGDGDAAVFGRGVAKGLDVPEGQGTFVLTWGGSKFAVAAANHNMDDNPSTWYIAPLVRTVNATTPWRKFADVADGVTKVSAHGDMLYFLSQKGASRFRLLATPMAKPDVNHAQVILPESDGVQTDFAMAREGIYVRERVGAVSRLTLVSFDGKQNKVINLPFDGTLDAPVTDRREAGALFDLQSWVKSAKVFAYDPASDKVEDTGLIPASKIDASMLESKEVLVTSYDGTRVPLSIIYKKGMALDGSHPTILIGYGSYGVSLESGFRASRLAWIERGGIMAVAHIRGGGEYGEDWHRGGMMRTKPNTFLDFIACGQYLVDQHYTAPKLLAGNGGSAGGITVGGAMTWRPDLFGVILDQVGMSDTLRAETEPNGPPNVSEFGTARDKDGFHGLYAMGAYHQVRDGVAYPAVMFTTGANDPRVAPWHMMKMAARVQAATSSGRPALLRIDYDAGHGIGSNRSQREAELADMWSFALWQMGDPAFQPK